MVAALGLVGGGVWAASSMLGAGAQPAEALPASTLGYASIDLDPSAAQKVEAFQMLRKFPAIKDELGLDSGDDLRKKLFDEIQAGGGCPDLGYRVDIEPWLGNRAAAAAVDTGADAPTPVLVLQVTDEDAADAGLAKIRSCATGGHAGANDVGGWVIRDGWAVIAESEELATTVADEAAESSLADDEDYRGWSDEVGDAGIVSLYAAPAVGGYLADHLGELSGLMGAPAGTVPDETTKAMKDFRGAAATIRFDDGSLELEAAGDPGGSEDGLEATDAGDDVVATLPADTAAALGFGFAQGWFTELVDQMAAGGGELTAAELMSQLSDASGLDLPGDAEALAGESVSLSVGGDLDPEAAFNSADGSDVPVAIKVKGDPERIAGVLDKVRPELGPMEGVLGSDSKGDLTAIGPDADYRATVLEDGGLGDTEAFRDVVRDAEDASMVFFVNFDAGDWLVDLASGDQEAVDNLEPLEGLGMSVWQQDDTAHAVLRLGTN